MAFLPALPQHSSHSSLGTARNGTGTLAELGNMPRYETIEQFKATGKRDRAIWAVVKAAGAKVD
jgi:hypothetical protein